MYWENIVVVVGLHTIYIVGNCRGYKFSQNGPKSGFTFPLRKDSFPDYNRGHTF